MPGGYSSCARAWQDAHAEWRNRGLGGFRAWCRGDARRTAERLAADAPQREAIPSLSPTRQGKLRLRLQKTSGATNSFLSLQQVQSPFTASKDRQIAYGHTPENRRPRASPSRDRYARRNPPAPPFRPPSTQGTPAPDSVIGDRDRTNAADGRAYVVRQCASVAREVEIARRPVDRFAPKCEEHRALEDKALAIGGFAEAVEESLRGVSLQQELETFSGTSAPLQQPCAYGRAHVSQWSACHGGSASR